MTLYNNTPSASTQHHSLRLRQDLRADLAVINQRMKTNLTTCWGTLATPALNGLHWIGTVIENSIVLMIALGREIIRSRTMANNVGGTKDCVYASLRRQLWNMKWRYLSKTPLRCYLLSRRVCVGITLVWDGIEIRVSIFPFPYCSFLRKFGLSTELIM